MNNILVCVETRDTELCDVSFELLAWARNIAAATSTKIEVLAIGPLSPKALAELGAADRVIRAEHPMLENYLPETYANIVAAVVAEREPTAVLISYTTQGMEVAPAVAEKTGRDLVSYCTSITSDDNGFNAISTLFGGKLHARTRAPMGTIFSMIPGSTSGIEALIDGAPETISLDIAEELSNLRTTVIARHAPDPNAMDLTKADKIVCVGRGIGAADNLEEVRIFASLIEAEIAGSRPVIDSGWLPKERQVGKSGTRVTPKLYIAMGVSGAPEHLEGMAAAELIIAVNSDPSAPIFDVAHYGTTTDMFELLPELTDMLER